jgi:hypothetical protein
MAANPNYPVPCVRLDANGNPMPCPHADFTVTYEDDPRHANTHYQRSKCNLCDRVVLISLPGEVPEEE